MTIPRKNRKTKTVQRTVPISPLRGWWNLATPEQRKRMADMVPISVRSIPAYAGGFRRASAEVAVGIERATTTLHAETKGRLPIIYRVFMSNTCQQCDFAAKCMPRSIMDASEFIVS